MRLKLTCFLVSLFYLNLFATDFFTDKGSLWLTGSGGYHYNTPFSTIQSSFNVEPAVRFFPCRYFFIGPDLSWNYSSYTYKPNKDVINQWGAGLDAGVAFGKNGHVIPYIFAGLPYYWRVHTKSTMNPEYGTNSDDFEQGIRIPVTIGLMIPLFDCIGLQIESRYTFGEVEQSNSNRFGFSFGFCGIGKRSAVSLLGNI